MGSILKKTNISLNENSTNGIWVDFVNPQGFYLNIRLAMGSVLKKG
jgi:hypothetical protein